MSEPAISRKRAKPAEVTMAETDDFEAVLSNPSNSGAIPGKVPTSYASILRNEGVPDDMEADEVILCDEDCCYSQGQHGMNVKFAESALTAFDRDWKFAVIVNLMGKPNSINTYDFILRGLRRKWRSHGGWKLIDLMNNFFIVKFDMEADMKEALCGGPWILAGQTLVVRRWRADFDARTDRVGSMAVWARIMGLPVRYFNKFAMTKIGKLIGEVVKVDSVTLSQERGRFARICVEVDLHKPFIPVIEVDGNAYSVRYEGLSLLCFNCGVYGHAKDHCPSATISDEVHVQGENIDRPSMDMESNPISGNAPSVSHKPKPSQTNSEPVSSQDGFGPWMLMDYKNKKKAGQAKASPKNFAEASKFSILQEIPSEESPSNALEPCPTSPLSEKIKTPTSPSPPVLKSAASITAKENLISKPKAKSVPEIIQMWSCLQAKIKEKSVLGAGIMLDNALDAADTSQTGPTAINASPASEVTKLQSLGSLNPTNSVKTRSKAKAQKKNYELNLKVKQPSSSSGKMSTVGNLFSENSDFMCTNFSGAFGRCPPEEIENLEINPTLIHAEANADGCSDMTAEGNSDTVPLKLSPAGEGNSQNI